MRQVEVSWATVPRYLAQPQNVEGAPIRRTRARGQGAPWICGPPICRGAHQPAHQRQRLPLERVAGVPGPDNRLDQQPTYTLNAGFDWPLRGTPLTVGGNFNFTPAFVVQQIDSQQVRQGVKRVIDAYALWRFSPAASLRLNIANAGALDYETGTTTVLPDGAGEQRRDTVARTYTTASLRAELRF
jgi:outer membrane receptor for ferrienterochelin and colicins